MTDEPAAPWALQTFSIRNRLNDPVEALRRVRAVGLTALEIHDAATLGPAIAGHYFTVVGAHADLTGGSAHQVWDLAEELGTTRVIQPWVPPDTWADEESVTHLARTLSEVARSAPPNHRVLYHNHDFEFTRPGLWEHFWEQADPALGAELDVFWLARAGRLNIDILPPERVFSLHLKDGPVTGDPFAQVPLGAGEVDLALALQTFPAAQRILEFDAFAGDIWQAIDESMTFIDQWSV